MQLVYVSSAAPASRRPISTPSPPVARREQRALGLTGLLLHQGAHFYGVLEGPRRQVFARMEEIITDRRHSRLRILREESIATRRFDNWSFGFCRRRRQHGARRRPEDFIWNLDAAPEIERLLARITILLTTYIDTCWRYG